MPRLLILLLILLSANALAQVPIADTVIRQDLERMVRYLAASERGGRVNFSKQQELAADYLANEMSVAGLRPLDATNGFKTAFAPYGQTGNTRAVKVKWNGMELSSDSFHYFRSLAGQRKRSLDDFLVMQVDTPLPDSLLFVNWGQADPLVIRVVLPAGLSFTEATDALLIPPGSPANDILLLASPADPESLDVRIPSEGSGLMYNLVGWLPGRSKADEIILFCAHYDHVDRDVNGRVTGDVFNGANDNASGTAGVLSLAKYFVSRNDNERSLVFCLFAGEELGLLGSAAFAGKVDPTRIKAVINLEMIGSTQAAGKGKLLMTGPQASDMLHILKPAFAQTGVKLQGLFNDPTDLFSRSDNFSFFQYGIPAHGFMCSDDKDPCYHQPCDDADRLDFDNMTRVILALARACANLVSGKETPMIRER